MAHFNIKYVDYETNAKQVELCKRRLMALDNCWDIGFSGIGDMMQVLLVTLRVPPQIRIFYHELA